jgi:hypothetical protein
MQMMFARREASKMKLKSVLLDLDREEVKDCERWLTAGRDPNKKLVIPKVFRQPAKRKVALDISQDSLDMMSNFPINSIILDPPQNSIAFDSRPSPMAEKQISNEYESRTYPTVVNSPKEANSRK